MDSGSLLSLLRCNRDGGELRPWQPAAAPAGEGEVRCATCAARFPIVSGVVDLLGDEQVEDRTSREEMEARDADARKAAHPGGLPPWHPAWRDELEIPETLACLGDLAGRTVLELGCGTGLYTRRLAASCARLIAVDFSMASLQINARNLPEGAPALLVRGDVSRLRLSPGGFDLGFTTLYSNLPTEAIRAAANQAVHEALKPGGRYVVSAHHQDLRRRLAGARSEDVYSDLFSVFYKSFTAGSLRRELRGFDRVSIEHIVVFVPLLSRLGALRRMVSRLAGALPFFRLFGQLLLGNARKGPR